MGWIVGPLILLECFQTKLIHYYLPAFPACALLVAWLILLDRGRGRQRRAGRWAGWRWRCWSASAWPAASLTGWRRVLPGRLAPADAPGRRVCIVAGTLGGDVLAPTEAADERAVFVAGRRWAVDPALLRPDGSCRMGEPYRTSRLIGEKLAAHRGAGIEPVLLEYQEPGVIYALGHPSRPRATATVSSPSRGGPIGR